MSLQQSAIGFFVVERLPELLGLGSERVQSIDLLVYHLLEVVAISCGDSSLSDNCRIVCSLHSMFCTLQQRPYRLGRNPPGWFS